ncbi:DUF4340 domain-containing protein [Pseudoflavonifractor phocaeensis]|uniref:DUF4340 domain-containing protein n=1 Tax=Pseudoflavonifractor phocaeensis TaxID=1870988 RepID=UPI00195F0735|nr:DUF4340 domain-containing protein [Pseudoflavonifractor phocaeensis]MBM6724037.1 DUF4340 domain-containing protein [Pseudoflavonifractor phocaeensis]
MKRGSKLLLLCGAMVVLGASYVAVRQLAVDPDELEETISLAGPASPQSLTWTDDSGTLTLNHGESGWSYADDSAFPLDQTVPEDMTAALSAAAATRRIDTPESLEDYGLDAPVLTITAQDEDGTEYSYAFGDVNELTGEYYLLYNGEEDTVYLVGSDLHDAFSYDLYDMVEMETLPEFGSVTGLSVDQPEGSLTLRYEENGSGLSYDPDNHWFLEQGDSLLALDAGKVSSLTGAITGLTWLSCVTYDVDDQELAAWGLGDSAAVVTATYTAAIDEGEETAEEETFVLRLGSTSDEGTYAMLEGSSMVYLIDSETADSLRYASHSSLRSDSICSMDWDTVDRLDITLDGATYTISFDVTETEEDGETVTDTLYTWDGQELDSSDVESMLSAINGLTATGDSSGSGGETQLVSFTFHRNTEDQFAQLTLTLSAWDTGSCLASFTREGNRLVDRSAVTDLTEQIQALFTA